MPVRINQKTFYGDSGSLYLQQQISSQYKAMEEKLRRAANAAAESAGKSLNEDLADHQYSGELIKSVKINRATGTSRKQIASASVGDGVKHSRWFFEGTGLYGPKKSIIYPVSAKKMGPIPSDSYRSGDGPRWLASHRGQKPNQKIIDKAQSKARRKLNERLRYLD